MKKKKTGRRVLSFLLTLALVLGLMPGMSMTAYAASYENIEITSAVYDATSVSTLINSLDGFCKLSTQEAKSWDPPTKSGYERLIYDYDGEYIRIVNFNNGQYVSDVGIKLAIAKRATAKYYYAKKTVVAVNSVTLSSATVTLTAGGDAVALTAAVAPDNATDKKVVWSVGGTDTGAVKLYSDEACTIEVGADATETLTVYAKGISAGSATVTATSNADSEKKASCDVTVNAAQTQTETLLTTITATGKEQASYSTENVATVSFSYTANGSSSYMNNGKNNWGWFGYGWSATVNAAEGYTITKCVFYDDKDRTATDSKAPFVVETTEEDKTPQVNGTPILAYTSKGITKIEVYGYATPTATHSVAITAGDHMTKTAGSGDAEQTGLTGAMKDVVYTADNGYYFPTNYSVAEVSGIKVTRDSYTQITVSGTPTADAAITLTAPTAKTTPAAPTTAAAVDCTTSENNDGKLTGVTTAMEYKKSDADSWTTGTGSDITGLVPGTYYVRVKATETTNASTNQELTIKRFISYTVTFKVANGKWNEGEGDAATADKTVTLTGHDGDTLKLTADQIPAVGTKPNDTYKAGSWDVTPSADTEITGATTYTYTYAQKGVATVTKAPEAKTLTYTGNPQELVTAGTAEGGTMMYAARIGDTYPSAEEYSENIPTLTNANDHRYVWYYVKGDANHLDSEPQCVFVEIAKASITPSVSIENWTYGESVKAPSVTGNTGNGAVTYTYAKKDTTDFSATVPSAAGEYTVKAVIAETDDYLGGEATADFTIARAEPAVTAPTEKTLTYNGSAQELVTAGKATGGEMKYALGTATKATQPYTTSIPAKTEAGTYYVWYKVKADENHNDTDADYVEVSIGKRSVTLTSATASKTYDGTALTNTNVTVGGDGFVTGEGATYDVTGTITVVGVSENTFTYTLKDNTKADNYDITPSFGTLTVTNRNTKYEVILKANSGTEKYDGKEKTVSGYTIDGNAGEDTGESAVTSFTASNGKTYTVTGMSAEVTGTNAGEYAVNVIGTPIVKDADGNDVTTQFTVSSESGKLTIDKRSVTLTSATDTKVYDGKTLSNDKITVSEDGFAEGEGATYSVTGSQKVVGSSANAFTYSLNEGTIADNYDITTVEGKLTVTKSDSSGEVTAVSGLVYDGKAKALVTAGKTEGGTLMYRLGTDGKWQQDIPEATDAGTYKIYYYIKGDDNHKDDGSEKEPKGSVETTIKKATINLKSVTQKNNKVQISWTKVNEADGYDVYIHYCGSKAKKPVKTIKKNTTTKTSVAKINGKKINQKKNFRVKVYAYKMVKGKKKIIAKTITAHLAGTKSVKYTNPKALKLTKSTYSIKVGKTAKIKAKVTRKNSKKKLLPKSHAAKLRYKSSNTKIATVNKNGTIKGKKKGTCYIYVYTVNGLMKKVKVTVK